MTVLEIIITIAIPAFIAFLGLVFFFLDHLIVTFGCQKIDEYSFQKNNQLTPPDLEDTKATIRFLGTSGFVLKSNESPERMAIIDPYFTLPDARKVLMSMLFRTQLKPNESKIETELDKFLDLQNCPVPKNIDVLIGHAHVDHILDAPHVCTYLSQKGATVRFFGSESSRYVANKAFSAHEPKIPVISVEETGSQLIEYDPQTNLPSIEVPSAGSQFDKHHEFIPIRSLHGKTNIPCFRVPNPGFIKKEPRSWPTNYKTLKHGTVLNWLIRFGSRSVLHIGSANLIKEDLDAKLKRFGRDIDLLCLCAASWNGPKKVNYIKTAIELAKPKYITTCHWDWFCNPGTSKNRFITPSLKLNEFIEEVRKELGDQSGNMFFMPIDSEFKF